jgi:hypothetical protein
MRGAEESHFWRQKVEQWLPGREGGVEDSCSVGAEFQFCKMKTVLEVKYLQCGCT